MTNDNDNDYSGLIDKIVVEAEEYAAEEAEKAMVRQLAEGAPPSCYAIVRFHVYQAAFSGAYYDRYFRLLREKTSETTCPPPTPM